MSRLVLPAKDVGTETSAVARVRGQVDAFLDREGIDAGRQDVLLVVSELVTNVMVHTDGAPAVTIKHDQPETVVIEVSDRSPSLPTSSRPEVSSVGGRGLWIVDQIATSWGVRPRGHGKTTWACVDVHADPCVPIG